MKEKTSVTVIAPETARPGLELPASLPIIPTVAQNRILAAVRSPRIFRDVGTAMILLVRILEKCGACSECTINYEQLHEETGQPTPTLKHWARDLEDKGFITKTKVAHGSLVHVNVDRLPGIEPDPANTDNAHDRALELVRALRGTVVAAFDGFINGQGAKAA